MSRTPLPLALAQAAEALPDQAFFQMVDDRVWTFGEMHAHALDWARTLSAVGVQPTAHVATLLPTSADAVGIWLGLGWLRALEAPINLEYRGRILSQVLSYSEATHIIVHRRYADAVRAIAAELTGQPTILVLNDGPAHPIERLSSPALAEVKNSAWGPSGSLPSEPPQLEDLTLMLFTSGTTGSPKGVLIPWGQVAAGASAPDLEEPVTAYAVSPLFHTGGRGVLAGAILNQRHVVFRERFSGSHFWTDIERYGCNFASLMATFLAFLGQAGLPADFKRSPLKYVGTGRVPESFQPIARRLGLKFSTVFNMTEISPPIVSTSWSDDLGGSCGRLRTGYHCRIVDDQDRDVAVGEPGELIIRADEPWVLMQGYWRRPEETVRAWRNLWFHTGDMFTRDEDDNYYFLDRKEDRIRRRGENISSEEIENAALRHPAVEGCSAIGIRSDVWDHEVKVVVLLRPNNALAPEALRAFMAEALPAFMVPRYIEFVDEIPRTPTGKAKRALLRQAGVTPGTWVAVT